MLAVTITVLVFSQLVLTAVFFVQKKTVNIYKGIVETLETTVSKQQLLIVKLNELLEQYDKLGDDLLIALIAERAKQEESNVDR